MLAVGFLNQLCSARESCWDGCRGNTVGRFIDIGVRDVFDVSFVPFIMDGRAGLFLEMMAVWKINFILKEYMAVS